MTRTGLDKVSYALALPSEWNNQLGTTPYVLFLQEATNSPKWQESIEICLARYLYPGALRFGAGTQSLVKGSGVADSVGGRGTVDGGGLNNQIGRAHSKRYL